MIGETLSHYRITGRLGAGGMGEVYRAEDTRLGREVALKVLPKKTARDVTRLERFSREARAVAALNHPNIVTIFSVEEAGGTHFLTMELVDGETLDHRLRTGGLPLDELFEIVIPLADALRCAHDKGIVHRDLKPANVMITTEGRVKVLDFGLAKLQGSDADLADAATVSRLLTQDGAVMGTYPYMSPEQVEGKRLDARTDLFSFGTIVYELCTGQRPFDGDSSAALMSSILRDEPDALAELRPDLPRHLGRILTRCMRKDVRDRFQSARSIHNELTSLRTESSADGGRARRRPAVAYERPWIAVAGFKVTGGDPELEDFAEGLAEDITAGLSRFSYLSVVNRASTRSAAGQAADVHELSEKLRARYLVEGSVRRAGSVMRVGVRLVDVASGAHLWAETYTRNLDELDIFETQDDVTGRVVATVADGYGVLARSLIAAIEDKPDPDLAPSEWTLRTFAYLLRMTPSAHARLTEGLTEAVERYPREADVWAALAQVCIHEWNFGFNTREGSLDRALAAAERAVALDRTNQLAYQMLAQAHFLRRDLIQFRTTTERAVSLNPLDTNTLGLLGIFTVHTGDFDRGAEMAGRAMALNPHHAGWFHFGMIWPHVARGEYEEALDRAARINMPGLFWTHLVTAVICGQLGRGFEARQAVARLLELDPDFPSRAQALVERWHFASGLGETILAGLSAAGLDWAGAETEAPAELKPGSVAPSVAPSAATGAPNGRAAEAGVAIAVLPFTDMSPAKDQAFFCEGMAEEIMNALTHAEGIRVASRLSAFKAREEQQNLASIGRVLSVGQILEGSVRVAGDRLRVTAQLIDVESGYQLWSERYDREAADVFAVQDEIAQSVLEAVQANLSPGAGRVQRRQRVQNMEAYRHYLKGRYLRYTKNDHSGARQEYERSVALDPDYGPAWVGVAETTVMCAGYCLMAAAPAYRVAREALARAETLQGESAEGRYVEGMLAAVSYDWDTAIASLKRAIDLRPDHVQSLGWLGFVYAVLQRADEALLQGEMAREADPLAPYAYAMTACIYAQLGRPAEGLSYAEQAAVIDEDNTLVVWILGKLRVAAGEYDSGIAALERATALARRSAHMLGTLGWALAKAGRTAEAEAALAELQARPDDAPSAVAEAWLLGALGRRDEAMDTALRACEEGQMMNLFVGFPGHDSLRGEPRFRSMVERMALEPPPDPAPSDSERARVASPASTPTGAPPPPTDPDSMSSPTAPPSWISQTASGGKAFVGREQERGLLEERLTDAVTGRGGIVLIGGEPGVGKTRLAEETLAGGRRQGMLALKGHAYEEQGAPYIPTIEILEDVVRAIKPVTLRQLLGDAAAEISRLLPELRRLFPDIPPPAELQAEQQRRYLFNCVLEFLQRVSRLHPLVIMLDDLHWADESSMLLLEHLAPHLRESPVLMIGTYRDVEADIGRPFSKALAHLVRQDLAERLPLRQLGRAEVGELLAAMARSDPPDALVDVIHRETEGNPFFVKEVFEHLREEGRLFDGARRWRTDLVIEALDVPEGVRLVINRRVERLSEDTPRLLTAAAAIGLRFDLDLLEAVGGDPDAVLDALDESESAQLVKALPGRRHPRYEFAHALVRHALLDKLSAPRLQRLHLDVAAALEQLHGERVDEQAPVMAHHLFEAGGRADAGRTRRFLRVAGEQAAATAAYDEALAFYDRALSLGRTMEDSERAQLTYLRGVAKRALPDWEGAAADWLYALPMLEAEGRTETVGRIYRELVYQKTWTHEYEEAQSIAERGLRSIGDAPSAERCRLLSCYAHAFSSGDDFERAEQLNREAIALAETLDDPRLLGAEALLARVYQYEHSLHGRKMVETAERAIALVREHGSGWELASTIGATLIGLALTGDYERAEALRREIETLAEREGNIGATVHCFGASYTGAIARGDFETALASAAELVDHCELYGLPWSSFGHAFLSRAHLYHGDWTAARDHANEAFRRGVTGGSHRGSEPAYGMITLAAIGDGEARARYRSDYALPTPGVDNGHGRWNWMLARIEAGMLLGHTDDAAALYPLAVQLREQGDVVAWGLGLVDRYAGMAAAAGGDWDRAEHHFGEAMKLAESLPHRIEAAETRRWYARCLLDRGGAGDTDKAAELLRDARARYAELGMDRFFTLVDELASATGASAADAESGVDSAVTEAATEAATEAVPTRPSSAPDGTPAPESLAVLPLANLAGDASQDFFVAGMHDALINELARIRSLSVISRTSTLPFAGSTEPLPDIAGKLGVDAVIEGSVLRAGDRVRINLQLVNARPEKHLWADSFDGALEDILDLHSRVAKAVSGAVRAQLTAEESERLGAQRKVDPAVYENYLRAKHLSFFSAHENLRGIKLYEEVIARDPDFAPAYAGVARSLVYVAMLGAAHFQTVLPRAADAARRAMTLDPDSGEARSIHGYVSLFHDWDFQTAGRSLAQARAMEPNNVSVLGDSIVFLALTGSAVAAVPLAERAAELDPMSATTIYWLGWSYFLTERYPDAIEAFARSMELDPGMSYPVLWTGSAHGLMGHADEALTWAKRAEKLEPESRNTDFLAVLGATYVMGGSPDDARRQLQRVESLGEEGQSYWPQRSYIHGWLGEYEMAAELADRAFAERNPGVIFWANHPICDASRAHPRIMENLEALGFPVVRPMRPWRPAGFA